MQVAENQSIMKYKLFLFSFLFMLSFPISKLEAQGIIIELDDSIKKKPEVFVPKFSFAIRAGLNVAQVFGAGSQAFNHFGFSGGVKFGYRFANKWSFNPEIIYNMKGAAKYPNVEKGDYYSFSIDLDYVEVPILFNCHFGKKHKFSLEFGPAIGVLVRQKAYENGSAINSTTTGFNLYDIGIVAGLNYYLPKGFGLNFRYMNSVAPIIPPSVVAPWGLSTLTIGQLNSVLNLSLHYTFDFRSREQKLLDGTIKEKAPKEKKVRVKKQKGDVIDETE
jgi:hypothetical protein